MTIGATMVEEILEADETSATLRLQCGHTVKVSGETIALGQLFKCPACTAAAASAPAPATGEQLDAVAAHYAEAMRARGFAIGDAEMAAVRRAAGIQDAWRVAFATVLGPRD